MMLCLFSQENKIDRYHLDKRKEQQSRTIIQTQGWMIRETDRQTERGPSPSNASKQWILPSVFF